MATACKYPSRWSVDWLAKFSMWWENEVCYTHHPANPVHPCQNNLRARFPRVIFLEAFSSQRGGCRQVKQSAVGGWTGFKWDDKAILHFLPASCLNKWSRSCCLSAKMTHLRGGSKVSVFSSTPNFLCVCVCVFLTYAFDTFEMHVNFRCKWQSWLYHMWSYSLRGMKTDQELILIKVNRVIVDFL